MKEKECIFCRIIKKEIPVKLINETDNFIAMPDANPKAEEEYSPDIKGSAGQSESEPVSKDLQIQKVSDYGSAENPKKKMIILIVVLLVILAVVLAGIFFFRSSLISLFNKFWG